jgi:acetyl esterase/lipase
MKATAATLSVLALVLGGLPLFQRRSTRPTAVMLMFAKFFGTALAPYVALAGALGAVLGIAYDSAYAVVAGTIGCVLAADYVHRVSSPHSGFERAFGADWSTRFGADWQRRMLKRRWSWRVPSVPEPCWTRDVPFWTVPGSNRQLLCDIWQPPAGVEPTGTAIVYLHGSAWYILDKDVLTRRLFRHLAAQGHVVMDVAYRLCPEVDVAGMVGDAKRAVVWMKANAARFGVSPERVVLMGASAGGHVALLAAYTPSHPRLTPEELCGVDTSVRAMVSYYGVPDLRAYDKHSTGLLANVPQRPPTEKKRRQPGLVANAIMRLLLGRTLTVEQSPPLPPHRQMMQDLVGGQPEDVPHRYDLASPIHHVSAGNPPTLLFHGAHDSLVPAASARRLHEALVVAGVPAVYVEFPRTEHGFDLLYPPLLGPAGQAALYDLERFLVCVTNWTPPAA